MPTSQPIKPSDKLAICSGKKSLVDRPKTPAGALKQLISRWSLGKLVFIQNDGSTVEQKYIFIWQRATQILNGMRANGLKPGDKVIFQFSRGSDFTAAFWSCLMGGFVPVPLAVCSNNTSRYLIDRFHDTYQFLKHPVVITDDDCLSEQIQQLLSLNSSDETVISLSQLESGEADTEFHYPQPNDLVLLLPSSGTTGKSKLITFDAETLIHLLLRDPSNIANPSESIHQRIYLRWLPLSHMSGLKITIPNAPTKIHLSTELAISNPGMWLDTIEKYQVSHALATNFFLSLVVKHVMSSGSSRWNLASVKKIIVGSETIVVKTVRSFLNLLVNHGLSEDVIYFAYGLTECNPIAVSDRTAFTLADKIDDDSYVEIGTPSPNHAVRIVDGENALMTEGTVGKIQVKGPYMTSGYYENLSANRDLFTKDGWLNTGDLGWLRNGRLTVTGRDKAIIIINALNFDSHEIELAVEKVEGVEARCTAACAVRGQDSITDELLILFYPTYFDRDFLITTLRNIRQKIYERFGLTVSYLIPVEKTEIPRTMTGKIQRTKVKQRFEAGEFDPALEHAKFLSQEDLRIKYVAPRSPVERQLVNIWQQVLSLEKIGIHNNFFELGGHSLFAVQTIFRIQDIFAVDLPMHSLFYSPTVAELALKIERLQQADRADFLPLKPVSATKIPLSIAQNKFWYRDRLEDTQAFSSIPRTLEIEGSLDIEIFDRSLQTIVERHAVLRTIIRSEDGIAYQQIDNNPKIELKLTDLQKISESKRKFVAYELLKQEAQKPFKLAEDYLIRFSLSRLSSVSYIFMVNMHHIISDGFSVEIFWQELALIYSSLIERKPNPLPPLPIQYADFVHWQQQWLKGGKAQKNYNYWSKQLAELPTKMNLPFDHPRSSLRLFGKGKGVFLPIDETFARQLRNFCSTRNVTLYMTSLAIWQLLLCYYSGQKEVVVNSVISGRDRFETQSLIGLFANSILLRTQCESDSTFEELIVQVRQTCLTAYAHQHISLQDVATQLEIKEDIRSISRVFFSLNNYSQTRNSMPMSNLKTRRGEAVYNWLVVPDLQLIVKDIKNLLGVSLLYNSDLFKDSTATKILTEFQKLAIQVINHPEKTVEQLYASSLN